MSQDKKTLKDYAAEGKQRDPRDEVSRDIDCWENSITVPTVDSPERDSAMLLRRMALLVGSGDLYVGEGGLTPDIKTETPAATNHLPVATYLTHGSRVIVDLPPDRDNPNKVFDWLTQGKDFDRTAATHGVTRNAEGQVYETKTKGVADMMGYGLRGAASYIPFSGVQGGSYHKGFNVAMYRPEDAPGSVPADGKQGHVYMYYNPPTDKAPGELMFGIEEDAPGQANHSLTGGANPASATGGRRLEEVQTKVKKEREEGEGVVVVEKEEKEGGEEEVKQHIEEEGGIALPIIPGKYNGMRIKLSVRDTDALTRVSDTEVELIDKTTLAAASPQRSVGQFTEELGMKGRAFQERVRRNTQDRSGSAEMGRS